VAALLENLEDQEQEDIIVLHVEKQETHHQLAHHKEIQEEMQ
jgi:hypothetical protein